MCYEVSIISCFQTLSNPNYENELFWNSILIVTFSMIGLAQTIVEISSYLILYQYLSSHNNKNMGQILKQSEINARNKVNAISLMGLVMGWFMKFWYVFLVGVLGYVFDKNLLREVSSVLKYFEFFLVPLVQIHTSAPLKKFRMNLGQP